MGTRRGRIGMLSLGAVLTLAGGTATVLSGHGDQASAAGTAAVVVHGTSFPDPSTTNLTLVGCDTMYHVAPETPQPMIGQGPGDAPIGDRSLAYDLAGGNALGAMFRVGSVLSTTTASVAVHPWGVPATGVGYVAYQDPDDGGSGLFWLGRTSLTAPGGGWSTIDVTDRAYTWTHYDMATMQVIGAGPDQAQPIADFAAQHGGDGPGVFTVGFGCNGTPFNIDDLQIASSQGSISYDLEGLTTTVQMTHSTAPSGAVTLRGTLASGNGDPLPDATLLLEQSDSPNGPWSAAGAVDVRNGVASTTVEPAGRTWYRWRFVDRPLAAGSISATYVVDGSGVTSSASPTTSASASPTTSTTAVPTATGSPTSAPTDTPIPSDSPTPSVSPSQTPSQTPSPTPSQSPSQSPSPPTSAPAGPSSSPSGGASMSTGPAAPAVAPASTSAGSASSSASTPSSSASPAAS